MTFLLACAMKATVILALAAIADLCIRKRSAALRHQVWAVAIVATIVLPALQLAIPGWHVIRSTVAIQLWRSAVPAATTLVVQSLGGITVNADRDISAAHQVSTWLLAIWIAGAVGIVLRLVIGFGRVIRLSSQAHVLINPKLKVTLLISQEAHAMPCTWGLRRPRILLPADWETWPEERRTMVLAHELAHIQRRDWPMRMLAEVMRAVYWFHPLAWMAAANLAEQGERACDDAVLASGVPAASYASCLLDLVRSAAGANLIWTAALGVARTHNLERRFTAMLDSKLDRRRTTRRSTLFATSTALFLLLPLAALTAPGQVGGQFKGTVLDSNGAALPNATIILTDATTHTREMTTSDRLGNYTVSALPSDDYQMVVLKPGFTGDTTPRLALNAGDTISQEVNLTHRPGQKIEDAVHSQIVAEDDGAKRLRVGGQVASANLIHQVYPAYPPEAKAARIQGAVVLYAAISAAGVPESLQVMNAEIDPDLARAAVEAVNQWRYKPTLLNGDPVAIEVTVTVNFTLAD